MGQYYKIVNLDKKEFLDPDVFGEGIKLMEFAWEGKTLRGLTFLLRKSEPYYSLGDMHFPDTCKNKKDYWSKWIGRWTNNRIAIVGDYDPSGIYQKCNEDTQEYEDISATVIQMLKDAVEWED